MAKKAKILLKTPMNEITYNSIIKEENNVYSYIEDSEKQTKTTFDNGINKLIREDEDLLMEYNFIEGAETIGFLEIKELNKKIEVQIKTKKIIKTSKKIEIEYELENELYKYILEME